MSPIVGIIICDDDGDGGGDGGGGGGGGDGGRGNDEAPAISDSNSVVAEIVSSPSLDSIIVVVVLETEFFSFKNNLVTTSMC